MTLFALLFSCGIILASYLPVLPALNSVALVLLLSGSVCGLLRRKIPLLVYPLALLFGLGYGIFYGYHLLAQQLPEDCAEKEIVVEGQVIDLPQEDSRHQLFSFAIKRAYDPAAANISFAQFPPQIKLSSFGHLRVKTGERWRLLVKLKPSRGFVNPGGFDYQAAQLRRGVGATGSVKAGAINQLIKQQPRFTMDVLRYDLQQWLIGASQSPEKGILIALLVGDTSLVDKAHWNEMLKTGTNHLIAISGLHLGFFAIVGFFIGNFIGRFVQLVWHKCPSLVLGYFFSIALTLFYSIIAGLNIPTLRTLIMLAVVQLAYVWRRSFRGRDTLLLALVLVLLYDPLAAYDIGFWLSFGAVAMLIFCFSGRIALAKVSAKQKYFSAVLVEFTKSQWVMFIGLLIPLAVFVHTSSLLAAPANFLAIPVITFFVVPCLILAAIFHFIWHGLENLFLTAAEMGLSLVHQWLSFLLTAGAGRFNPLITFSPWAIVLAMAGVLLVLLPRGLGSKKLGAIALGLALVAPLKPPPNLQLLTFDVGQGTSVLVRTPHHQLLYDTGPIYSENFDAGSGIVVPYLQGQGLRYLDMLVVSHNDLDHSGGLAGVLAATEVDRLLMGEPEKYDNMPELLAGTPPSPELCHQVSPWQWDEVSFRFITWPITAADKANNRSCVLLIEYQGHRILLAGDIEKPVENSLVAAGSLEPVEVLLAPHHGSHSSSTPGFVAQTKPEYVVYSAGYRNHYGHPHKDILARYASSGATGLNTAFTGALEFNWHAGRPLELLRYRAQEKRYWFALEAQTPK